MSRLLGVFLRGSAAASMVLLSPGLWGQDDVPLKARELFYKPLNATPASHPANPPGKIKKTPAKKTPAQPVAGETLVEEKSPDVRVAGGALVKAGYSPQPLGLKYTIAKQAGEQYREVDPETEFHSGERIRVNVEANGTAYLYIVMQGSSGTWQLLFPNAAISGGDNRIERGKVYRIPPADLPSFYFDERPGTEKVTLILTRTPEEDLEKLIYSAGERNKAAVEGKTIMAANTTISGEVMGQVQQQMLSRDLVFEKADGGGAGGKTEKAMYVATPDTGAGARVYVDLKLIHK
jgi:Domain of unknown function (DUF4384)